MYPRSYLTSERELEGSFSDDDQKQADLIAKSVYLSNYPYQGLYSVLCHSNSDGRCSEPCKQIFPDDTPFYKNRLERAMEAIPSDCQFDVLHHFDDVPTLSTSRTFEMAAVALEPSFFPLLDDLSELVQLSFRIFYEEADDRQDSNLTRNGYSAKTAKWALGLWTSLPSGTGECGSIVQTASATTTESAKFCYTDDLNPDTIFALSDCLPSGQRKLSYQVYHLEKLSLENMKFDRTEDVVAWNRNGSPGPACVSIVDSQIGLAASTTLMGKANVFTIQGGPDSQLLSRHTRDLQQCHECDQAGYHWCSVTIPLPRDHSSFDPDIPQITDSTYNFPPSDSCYMNPLLCPGIIKTCEGSLATLPGYRSLSSPSTSSSPITLLLALLFSLVFI